MNAKGTEQRIHIQDWSRRVLIVDGLIFSELSDLSVIETCMYCTSARNNCSGSLLQ